MSEVKKRKYDCPTSLISFHVKPQSDMNTLKPMKCNFFLSFSFREFGSDGRLLNRLT